MRRRQSHACSSARFRRHDDPSELLPGGDAVERRREHSNEQVLAASGEGAGAGRGVHRRPGGVVDGDREPDRAAVRRERDE